MLWIVGAPIALVGQARAMLDGALRAANVSAAVVSPSQHAPQRGDMTLALGDATLRALVGDALPDERIDALRGYFWDAPCGRVLGSMCPSEILGNWTPWRALLDFDVRRARDEAALGAPPLAARTVHVVLHAVELDALLRAVRACSLLAVDIENTHELELACVGFAPGVTKAWVIPAVEGWQLDAIRALCESGTPKALQNGQYDRFFLQRFANVTLRNQTFDTQLAWHALNPELAGKKTAVSHKKARGKRTAKSLKFLASLYTRDAWWKEYAFTSEAERYTLCGKDCCVTLEIAQKMAAQLEAA